MARREYQTWNRGDSYYDMLLAQLLGEGVDRMTARQGASEAEDIALRGSLGSKRTRRKGEQQGSYVLAKYPGVEHWIEAQEHGFVPRGHSWRSTLGESPQERMMREQKQREWAAIQRGLLGMSPRGPQRRRY